ncbi:uncharacterized protein BX663DRAFT_340006 [Cokeromyces recurvatus]|uniref:uncharacterized protein n=1 Tax=Cokeromyces recurvatus TaxID=90255 RepID=UPI00221FD55D|nr:uncharacterized protein BX663DRAFT_340006 [Cokeromyces recurvatus]KAI7904361.1 hypothetical protein BX663DRAFT_340006 [Cokeromyces recurvatus]
MIHFYKPVTLGEKLDMMSARLMNEIDLNDIHQVNALKLSLSRIVDTVNANVKSIFQKYIQDEVFWQKISNTSIELCPGMSEEEKKLYNTIIQRSKDDCNDKIDLLQLRLNIVLEKANMIQSSQTNNLKLLDIMEIVTKNCTDDITKINKKESETTCYRKLAKILDELLEGTNLDMLDGEITCEATKIIAKEQAKIFSNTIRLSRSFGRRIDLILSAKEIELSANEWKKEKTVITQSLKQQNKNLRVNKAILTHVEKLPLENEIFIIGMDWTGFMGYMFGLKHLEDIYIAKHISNLIIPKYSCQISSFIETLDRLYSWKNSLIMLKNIVLNATLKHEESEFFARVGTTPAPTQAKSLSPNIYLTPHRKKAVYSNIDEDIYDEDVYDEDDYNDNEHDIF